jgi:hypothetical protein
LKELSLVADWREEGIIEPRAQKQSAAATISAKACATLVPKHKKVQVRSKNKMLQVLLNHCCCKQAIFATTANQRKPQQMPFRGQLLQP